MSSRSPAPTTSETTLPVAIRIIETIADAKGVTPDELGPVHEYVDLEALEQVVRSANADLYVRWSVDNFDVEVDGTGAVRVV